VTICVPQLKNFKIKIGALVVPEIVEKSQGCDSAGTSASDGGGGGGRG
jgi:hypothetical protein